MRARVWLHDQMLAQADWAQQAQVAGEETASRIYSVLQRPFWRMLYRVATWLPTRMIIVTDVFAVAWKSDSARPPLNVELPRAYLERLLSRIAR
jgi:hypothetical protein